MNVAAFIALTFGSSFAITMAITRDVVSEAPRRWLQARPWLHWRFKYLLGCPWCMSRWVSPPVAGILAVWGSNRVVLSVAVGLSAATLVGLVALVVPSDDDNGD